MSVKGAFQQVDVLLLLVLVANCLRAVDCGNLGERPASFVIESCAKGLDFESVKEFKQFIDSFKKLKESQLKHDSKLKYCYRDREAILELEALITTDSVCDLEKIDDLVAYHKKHFSPRPILIKMTLTQKFFERYAIQVAHICKKNLLKNLNFAREELSAISKTFEEARDKVYQEEPSIKSNIAIIESQPDEPSSMNVKPRDQVEVILNEYREALTKLTRPEDVLTFEREDCKNSKLRETIISKDRLSIFFKPATMCHQLHRYYAGSVLSIAKLANNGYSATDDELDQTISEEPSVRDWVIAAQVCEPMLHIATKTIKGEEVTIDTCADKVSAIETMVYDDKFDELDMESLEKMIPLSRSTRSHAQKLMKSAYRKMAKADIMRQVRTGASKRSLFAKSLAMWNKSDSQKQTLGIGEDYSKSQAMSKLLTGVNARNRQTILEKNDIIEIPISDEEAFDILKQVIDEGQNKPEIERVEGISEKDGAVAFDPLLSVATTLTVWAIMLCFEWIFFIVMTLAARICNHFYFNFDNLLTFPPKILSWSDADFAKFNDQLEKMDEDDFFDYDELTPDEQQQRVQLAKVFGRPPPMMFKE